MKSVTKILCGILFLSLIFACKQTNENSEQLKLSLKTALAAYYSGDIEAYKSYLDFGETMDSIQMLIMTKACEQRLNDICADTTRFVSVVPTKIAYKNDSLATIYYVLSLSNGQKEPCSQKMRKIEGDWKLVMRN